MKIINTGRDRRDDIIALCDNRDGTFKVIVQRTNREHGMDRTRWVCINKRGENNTQYTRRSEMDARKLFSQRSA